MEINNNTNTVDLISVPKQVAENASATIVSLTDLGTAGNHLAPATYTLMSNATSTVA